ncbi:hypothetical protein G6F16_004235 [Rhizopus arrhizus]|nr:hypothetical protein G6F24_009217 [Rhizopus arrhizus]KAG0785405.1 hypothetical protein G6F21_009283 [Rhizopus arrhizus]KAG0785857.1 hypothetical protein G6F22_007814 [Rhizopus arrhizus]KAG0808696.1 hypothetical protein G6F20_009367 [Rhizopus arrhizus]KAG0825981.1 hypothetical protein G6F19_009526 [Rhizopus arrhizus]
MNFKDLQYSIGKLKSDVQSQLARNNPMQKQDTKSLSLWIFEERNDLASMRTLAYQRLETNKALKQWVTEPTPGINMQDLEDIVGDKLVRLFDKQVEIEQEFARKYQHYRQAIKSIREREDRLSDVREKKRSLQSRITNLAKTNTRSPKLAEFQKELKSLEQDTHESELDLANFKRFALKEAFYLRLNAMNAYAEKTALLAGFGKYLVDLIEVDAQEYERGPQAAIIVADALNALDYWKPAAEDERPTYADRHAFKGKTPEAPHTPSLEPSAPVEKPVGSAESSSTLAPQLPPRNPAGYSPHEVQQVTGDLKTKEESEIDLSRMDLYDAPPPAYEPPASSPLNADHAPSFYSPYQAHATPPLPPHHLPSEARPYPPSEARPYQPSPYPTHSAPHPSYHPTPSSPYPPTPYQTHSSPRPAHLQASSSFAESPHQASYGELDVDYHRLYQQQATHPSHEHRPYEEFQQRYNRVDAGGFRVPPPLTAEEEKERLARHYAETEKTEEEK